MALSRVPGEEELFVGSIFALRIPSSLINNKITHILSIIRNYDYKSMKDWEKYEHLNIPVDDVEDENLLGEFERTGSWIEDALKGGGGVFVHCAMGKSRSAAIILAYLLRQQPLLTVPTALELLRTSRAIAEPNDGFMSQLNLYKEMGCPRDIDSQPKYQRWLYQHEVDLAIAVGQAPERVRFEDEELQDSNISGVNTEGDEVELRCKRCRRNLATTPYLVTHEPLPLKEVYSSPTAPIASLQPTPNTKSCTHHFLHPLSWMRTELEQGLLNGRLECPNPNCKAQIGRYAWQGMKCSCGVWVCPAFSLQKGRVDEVIKKGGVTDKQNGPGEIAGGIRLPPGMRQKPTL